MLMYTKKTNTANPVMFASTIVDSRGTPTTALNRGTPTTEVNRITPTPTVVTTPGNAVMTLPTPSGPHVSSTDHANIQLKGKYVPVITFINNISKYENKSKGDKEIKPH